ncbi:MAG: Stk1 family PASTA domain-containing Ser/Thr kinase [Peptococcaceae bacterium]|nr:Stk1 family PASTA domain-containing Ser/Thr kinase [Peptococcaceae bacterium]
MIGKLLGNRYQILEQLGGGGMAIVYKGRDNILNRLVTIKLLRSEYTSDEDFVRRFRREAQSVASLSHPNIVSIYDVGRENDMHYLVMEYVEGEDLRSIIKREGPLDPERAVRIARQVCDALDHAHENNIVHRDVKPHNILITRTGRAKLTDFGIAREASAATVTTTDTIIGSVHYLSPEQARGELAGPKSDIYSLGVVLYEMLAGSVPFTGDSPISIAIKHIQNSPEPLARRRPGIPPELELVVMRALQKDPDGRFDSAREMSYQLEEAMAGDDDDTTRIIAVNMEERQALKAAEQYTRIGRRPSRRLSPAGWAVIAVVLALVMGGAVYGFNLFVNVEEVKVPGVVGKTAREAQDILAEKGLRSRIVEQYHQSVPKGIVFEQDYGPEDPPVKVNRLITLKVSLGADIRTVPNLVKLSLTDARAKIAEAGFDLEEPPQEVTSNEIEKGCVVSQKPAAYEKAPKGSKVTLTVSKGPEQADKKVPDLRGLTTDQAGAKLRELKLELDGNIIYQTSTKYLKGQIVSQFPEPNEMVTEGKAVRVTVSQGPGPPVREAAVIIEIPNDGRSHVARIQVTDVRGANDVYVRNHNAGDKVKETVSYYGTAVIRVFIDDKKVTERTVD